MRRMTAGKDVDLCLSVCLSVRVSQIKLLIKPQPTLVSERQLAFSNV